MFRYPALNPPVRQSFLSTRETREFASGNVGFGLNPGVELAPPRNLSSNHEYMQHAENLRNVPDTVEVTAGAAVNETRPWVGPGRRWLGALDSNCR